MAALLDFRSELFLLFFIDKLPWNFPPNFKSVGLSVQEKYQIHFQDGSCGSHVGFPMGMILVIFYLQITSLLPTCIKLRVYWPFGSGKVQNRFTTWWLRWPSLISDRNDVSYFLSTSHNNTCYQVSSQLAFGFRRSSNYIFEMTAILDCRSEWCQPFFIYQVSS